jgi:uncharacterized C2H2 Zn-finger protein
MSVYLVQPEILINTNKYKIGRSSNVNKRLYVYHDCVIHMIINCGDNCDKIESELIQAFKCNFNLVAGNEYFEGDIVAMKALFSHIACNTNNRELDIKIKEVKKIKEIKVKKIKEVAIKEVAAKEIKEADEIKNNKIIMKGKIYTCKLCHKKYTDKSNFNKHMNRKNPCVKEENKCTICNKIFFSQQTLNRHLNKKTQCNTKEYYKCPDCDKRYLDKQSYKLHLNEQHSIVIKKKFNFL